ncbi:hypothetical protein I79_025718 [Cricetulus griseus]|uniref:Uncharacterized protein n=1 Tax=Cricetulus griseus TaxID=10029 RepID=G3IP17_CRIGR|nr:hypothetical protein I79_025718 [Cricetulus griseus]
MPKVTAWTLFLPDFIGRGQAQQTVRCVSCSCHPQQKKTTCAQRVVAFPVTMVTAAEELVVGFGQDLLAHLSMSAPRARMTS